MIVLALDSAMSACSAALLRTDGAPVLIRRYERMERGHAEALMPMVREVMEEAGVGFAALDRIAVTTGPGTFSGVRIGVAAARGLALAAGKPLVGATSLHVIAHQAIRQLGENGDKIGPDLSDTSGLIIAADARRGQLYVQLFSSTGAPLSDAQVLSPEDALALIPENFTLVAGTGAARLAAEAAPSGRALRAVLGDLQPDAGELARLALTLAPRTEPLAPLYLRPPDAKPQAGHVLRRQEQALAHQ